MAASTVIKHFTDGTILLEDGTTPTAADITLVTDQGDLSISGLTESQREAVPYQSRGTLHAVRKGAKTFPTGSLSIMLADVSDGTEETLIDFVLAQASFSTNKSTRSNDDVYTIKITLTIEGTDFNDAADHTIVLDDCHCTADVAEGSPNTVTINFICYGTITMT